MAGKVIWPKEDIPNGHLLYMRVHRCWLNPSGELRLGVFRNHGTGASVGMSTEWSFYSAPEQTRQRAKSPEDNGVISMVVGRVREIPGQLVEHTPDIEKSNRAHTDVFGEKTEDVRVMFGRLFKWEILPKSRKPS